MRTVTQRAKALAKKFTTKDDHAEVNPYGIVLAVLMLTVGISLVAMFNGIFPAVTGDVIEGMNVTEDNNIMFPVVDAVDDNAVTWFGLNSTVMTVGIVAVLASIALSIFAWGRR
jgi:hypothetical protein